MANVSYKENKNAATEMQNITEQKLQFYKNKDVPQKCGTSFGFIDTGEKDLYYASNFVALGEIL